METRDEQWEKLYLQAKVLADRGMPFREIEEELAQKSNDGDLIREVIQHARTVHYAIRRKNGILKLSFGSILLVLGFFITVFNYHSNQSFTHVMYGFTSAGLLLLFWGLYDVIG